MSLKQKLNNIISETKIKLELIDLYPDLDEIADEYKITRLVTNSVNRHVDEVEFLKACNCCPKAEVFAYPFLSYKNCKVYSYPMKFKIGNVINGNYINTNFEWEDDMYYHKIDGPVVVKVMEYLNSRKQEYII